MRCSNNTVEQALRCSARPVRGFGIGTVTQEGISFFQQVARLLSSLCACVLKHFLETLEIDGAVPWVSVNLRNSAILKLVKQGDALIAVRS